MLDVVRRRLRDTVVEGDSPSQVDAKVVEASPAMGEERLAAMWLYGWHHAGGDDACRASSPPVVGHRP
jgi:hypothetical protein